MYDDSELLIEGVINSTLSVLRLKCTHAHTPCLLP